MNVVDVARCNVCQVAQRLQRGRTRIITRSIDEASFTYDYVKSELLKFYENETKRNSRLAIKRLQKEHRKAGESVYLYALRLAELARTAFPGLKIEQVPYLREKLIYSLPNEIRDSSFKFVSS